MISIEIRNKNHTLPPEIIDIYKSMTTLQQNIAAHHITGKSLQQSIKLVKPGIGGSEAKRVATRMLNSQDFNNFIDAVAEFRLSASILTREEVMLELSIVGGANLSDVFDLGTGRVKKDADPDLMKSITRMTVGQKSVTYGGDKVQALKALAEMQGYNKPKEVKVDQSINKEITIEDVKEASKAIKESFGGDFD